MRIKNKDTGPLNTPSVVMENGRTAPSITLPPGVVVDLDEEHADALAEHPAILARIRAGLLVSADEDEAREATQRMQPSPMQLEVESLRVQFAGALERVSELEAALKMERAKSADLEAALAATKPAAPNAVAPGKPPEPEPAKADAPKSESKGSRKEKPEKA